MYATCVGVPSEATRGELDSLELELQVVGYELPVVGARIQTEEQQTLLSTEPPLQLPKPLFIGRCTP